MYATSCLRAISRAKTGSWLGSLPTLKISLNSELNLAIMLHVFAWRIFQLNPDWARFGRTGPTLCIPVPVTFSLHWSHSYYISRYISRYISFWTRIPRSVPGRYLGRIDPMFQISRDLSVESGPKVSEAGPGSVRALRPNSISDFQYRPVLDFRSVGPVLRSNPASTRPGPITVCTVPWEI